MSRARILVALACALAAAGCGKSNLEPSTSASATGAASAGPPASAPPGHTATTPPPPSAAPGHTATTPPAATTPGHTASAPAVHSPPVALPLALTAARAAAFAHAVQLTAADVPGAHAAPHSKTPAAREREASHCGGRTQPVIGGARSQELQRGHGLDRESLSSSVEVLRSAKSVERDLSYVQTSGGLHCYERVLGRSLQEEAQPDIKLLGVRVAPLEVSVAGAGRAKGIRILARVGVPGAGTVVPLYVDALSMPYGPAEIDLYGTSFVQPVAERTEQELLSLLHQRARTRRL